MASISLDDYLGEKQDSFVVEGTSTDIYDEVEINPNPDDFKDASSNDQDEKMDLLETIKSEDNDSSELIGQGFKDNEQITFKPNASNEVEFDGREYNMVQGDFKQEIKLEVDENGIIEGYSNVIYLKSTAEDVTKPVKAKFTFRKHCQRITIDDIVWYQCKLCEYRTQRRGCLMQHFTAQHDEEAEWYYCHVCNFQTKIKFRLDIHVKLTHDDNSELHHCQSCDFKTKSLFSLRRHVEKNCGGLNIEFHYCKLCNYKTRIESYLTDHAKWRHNAGKLDAINEPEWHTCRLCPYKTKYKNYLIAHVGSWHKESAGIEG